MQCERILCVLDSRKPRAMNRAIGWLCYKFVMGWICLWPMPDGEWFMRILAWAGWYSDPGDEQ